MIKRLRRKFILINLLLVGLVLAVVFILFVGANARRLAGQSDAALRLALSWQDGEGPPRFEIGGPPPEEHEPDGAHRFSLIPVFVVTVKDGAIASLNDGGQVDVSEETAAEAVEQAQSTGASQGVLRELRLRFLMERRPDGELRIAFADLGWETASLRNLSLLSLLVWALAMVGLFFVSLVLSSVALRPAEQAWQQQRQFVADASHELKTPLTVIMTDAELLQDGGQNAASQAGFLSNILTMSRQMRALIEQMLELARTDSAESHLVLHPVDLSGLTARSLLPFEPLFFEQGLTLTSQVDEGITVSGDEEALRRVLEILLDNAQKYSSPGGETQVTLHRRGRNHCALTVANQGEPIPPEARRQIFQRFYRADPARSRNGSFGLGLSIAEGIVAQHHGTIDVTCAGGFNRFWAELPCRQE